MQEKVIFIKKINRISDKKVKSFIDGKLISISIVSLFSF